MNKNLGNAISEISDLYFAVREEWHKADVSGQQKQRAYMQGQKDGIRKAMALMGDAIGQKDAHRWALLQESSMNPDAYGTRLEVLEAQVADAYRILDMLQTGQTYRELKYDAQKFVDWVKRMGTLVDRP